MKAGPAAFAKAEYLGKNEVQRQAWDAPRSGSRSSACESFTQDRGDFTFDGHRLSSLYRTSVVDVSELTRRYPTTSFLQKYSNPAVQMIPSREGRK